MAESEDKLEEAFEGASREGEKFFSDPTVYVERYLPDPRHVEVQVLADAHGNVIHLFERDCSVQRRHQKLIEESPAPAVDPELRERIGRIGTEAARAVGYRSAGTIEGLLADGEYFFLEMNTRVQVEHCVTEMVTGIDIVREQLKIAAGEPLAYGQDDVVIRGHAIECRINAEDASKNFAPAPGRIESYREPAGPFVRVDSGAEAGYEVLPLYDPMIAKLIVWDVDREASTRRMLRALGEYEIGGLKTLIPFHQALLQTEQWQRGETCRDLVEDKKWLKQLAFPAAEKPAPTTRPTRRSTREYAVEVSGRRFDVRVIGEAGGANGASAHGAREPGAAARAQERRRRRRPRRARLAHPGHRAEGGRRAGRHGGRGRAHLRDRGHEDGERDHRALVRDRRAARDLRGRLGGHRRHDRRHQVAAAVPAAVVVGAGTFGASLADRLAAEGWEVTLVDRFGAGHPRAESGGETRLLRFSHGDDVLYTRLARRARELWLELGGGVLVESGVAWLARRADGWEAESERVLRAEGIPVERLAPEDGAAPPAGPVARGPAARAPRARGRACCTPARGVRALVERAPQRGARAGDRRGTSRRAARCGWASACSRRDAVVWACGAWLGRPVPRARLAARDAPAARALRGRPRVGRAGMGRLRRALVRARARSSRTASRSPTTPTARRSTPTSARSRRAQDARPARATYLADALPGPRRRPARARTRLPLQPHRRLELPVRPRTPASRACGCSAAARDTASSTVPPWPSTRRRCSPAAPSPSPASRSASAAPGGSLRTAGSSAGVSERRRLLPLVLATAATQASIVVLAPLLVEIGREFDASLGEVGLARSVLAGTAVAVSLAIGPLIDRCGRRAR